MDVNAYMNTVAGHNDLQEKIEQLILQDKQNDEMMKYSEASHQKALEDRIKKLEAAFKEQSLFEKKLVEQARIREINNIKELDKRSSKTKFK